jgi:hypothetical protein
VKDLPVTDLAAFLIRIGHTTTSFEAIQFNSPDHSIRATPRRHHQKCFVHLLINDFRFGVEVRITTYTN